MRKLSPVPYGALFFAPMEGITDEPFRKTILKLYPEWDYLATDFLSWLPNRLQLIVFLQRLS